MFCVSKFKKNTEEAVQTNVSGMSCLLTFTEFIITCTSGFSVVSFWKKFVHVFDKWLRQIGHHTFNWYSMLASQWRGDQDIFEAKPSGQ